jgi:Restriction endonuclease BglI
MKILESDYYQYRQNILNELDSIVALERKYADFLFEVVFDSADDLFNNFVEDAQELLPFWRNYPPEQRGNYASGTGIPMLDFGEKIIAPQVVSSLVKKRSDIRFPGLPTGADLRFTTNDALIHLDVKVTGPNDNPDEVVVPPNQVSGDGLMWRDGIVNSGWPIFHKTGGKKGNLNYHFQPKLPPFYVLKNEVLVCLTFFLKAIYSVESLGVQPLKHFEVSCVPNGLLMFQGPVLANTPGLIIAGKDEVTKSESTRRIRIRLDPLASIASWRSVKLERVEGKWRKFNRVSNTNSQTKLI